MERRLLCLVLVLTKLNCGRVSLDSPLFGVSLVRKYYYSWGSDSWQIRGTVLALSRSEFLHSDCGLPAGLRLLPDHGGHHQGEEFIQLAPGGELSPVFRTFWWQPQAEFSTWFLAGRHSVSIPPWWVSHCEGLSDNKPLQSSTPSYPRSAGIALASLTILTGLIMLGKISHQNIIFQVSIAVHTLADLCKLCQVGEVLRVSTGIPLYKKQSAAKPREQRDTRNESQWIYNIPDRIAKSSEAQFL